MRSLSENISRLAAARGAAPGGGGVVDRLTAAPVARSNPGALDARAYVPKGLAPGAPLVVALHGCTQSAAGYDHGTGWSTLADQEGFALLFPEQVRTNNPNLCFNWFQPGDIGRTGGEAESIAELTEAMLARHDLDRGRVFVTGLSAGGAMTAVMLATYPDLFAGGAIIGGLPYGCAADVPEALRQMRERESGDDPALADRVRRAAEGYAGPWPSVSLWHGSADATVSVSNMERLGRQWRRVHGIEDATPSVANEPGVEHRAWTGADGRPLVEEWRIAGMGHGVPIDPAGPERLGAVGPYMLDAGVSSTARIARTWGLVSSAETVVERPAAATTGRLTRIAAPEQVQDGGREPADALTDGIQQTIERALRSAGLMR
ncbi:MAG TPA: PHB depolymerase family esterase [Sphingomonas sp.]